MKQIDESKLRGWAKQTHMELKDLKRRITHLEVQPLLQDQKEPDYVKFQPIRYPPVWLPKLRKRHARLCQVQNWTLVDGKLTSLETGSVDPGEVYLAVHREAVLEGKEIPGFDEWLKGLERIRND